MLAQRLATACETDLNANSAAELREDCALFVDALGESIGKMKPDLMVIWFVSLEETLESQDKRDQYSDLPVFTDHVLKALRVMVKAAGIMIGRDTELASIYRAKPGADAFVPIVPAVARKMVRTARDAGLAGDDVAEIIDIEAKQAASPHADEAAKTRLDRDTGHVARRLLGRIMKRSGDILGSTIKNAKNLEVVGGWLKSGWQWVAENQAYLRTLLPSRADLGGWIDQVIAALKHLGH